jgi:hypothetical protein
MSGQSDLADRVQQLEAQVTELRKEIEALLQNPKARRLGTVLATAAPKGSNRRSEKGPPRNGRIRGPS